MKKEVADYIKTQVSTISWAEVVGGMVFVINDDGKVYPIEKITPGACDTDFRNYVPDDSYKSILYLEDRGTTVSPGTSRYHNVSTELRLVGWVNYNLINEDQIDPEQYMLDVINVLPDHFSTANAKAGTIFVTGMHIGDVFQDYTYNIDKQFYMYPFGAFAIDITMTYRIIKGCKVEVASNPASC